jgi:triacylglycerol lipase
MQAGTTPSGINIVNFKQSMIARITRILILLQVATAIALAALTAKIWHIDSLWLAFALASATVLVLRLLITANNFFLAWIYRSETPFERRLNWRQAYRLFKEEFSATMSSSSWFMPFHTFDKRPAQNSTAPPVLLVHGYGCNSGYWKQMSKALVQANITHHAVDMEPILGTIDAYVPIVHRAVEILCDETERKEIIIVAHSMGGLVARAYLRRHGSARVAKVITLGTPHHGTCLANFSVGINGQQMRWTGDKSQSMPSSWLRQLADSENDAVRALFVSIYSHHDNIISPQNSSYLPGAKNIEFHGIGHVALALNPAIQTKVIEEIYLASQAPTTVAAPQTS